MSNTPQILVSLAEVLGVPVEAFIQGSDLPDEQIANPRETAELLDAWARIDDRQARRRCLSYVKSAAERSENR